MAHSTAEERRATLTPVEGVEAALLFKKGQIYAQYLEGQEEVIQPISHASALRALSTTDIDTGWLAPGVLRSAETARGTIVLSYRPPGAATIILDTRTNEPSTLSLTLPGLILVGVESRYQMWALASAHFSPQDELYQAPLPNTGTDGAICFGANQLPRVTPQTIREVWELFWASPFNEHSIQGKSRTHPNDIRPLLLALARGKRRKRIYPVQDLVRFSYGVSVARAWECLSNFEKVY
jgi:hypothetical protein